MDTMTLRAHRLEDLSERTGRIVNSMGHVGTLVDTGRLMDTLVNASEYFENASGHTGNAGGRIGYDSGRWTHRWTHSGHTEEASGLTWR